MAVSMTFGGIDCPILSKTFQSQSYILSSTYPIFSLFFLFCLSTKKISDLLSKELNVDFLWNWIVQIIKN